MIYSSEKKESAAREKSLTADCYDYSVLKMRICINALCIEEFRNTFVSDFKVIVVPH